MHGYSKEHAPVVFAMKIGMFAGISDENAGETGPEPVPEVNIGRFSNRFSGTG
jgi:hypothetical protein